MPYVMTRKHYFNQTPLYERNYAKLLCMFRGSATTSLRVRHACGMTFRATLAEDHRYTSVVDLAVSADGTGIAPAGLRMTVRMYHDARVAEVTTCSGHNCFQVEYGYPNPQMHQPDEKAQLNRLLGEWLDFFTRRSGTPVHESLDAT